VKQELTEPRPSEPSEDKAGFTSLFRNRQFMNLWIAQIFSQFSDRAVFVLFVATLTAQQSMSVGQRTIGAAEMTSWLYVAFTIPAVVLGPVAGVYVDRWSNRAVLVVSNLARGFFVVLIMVPWISHSAKLCLLLAFFLSIGSQFFGPAETSSIPRLVKKGDLLHANSLFFTTMMIALGFGFAIGEPIISVTGVGRAPLAVAAGFFIAALLLLGISDNKISDAPREAWFEELRMGMAYIVDSPPVFRAILKITLLFSTIITLNIIAVGLAEQVMHIEPSKFGYVVAAAGLGMGIGNVWVARIGNGIAANLLVYRGFAGLGLFMALLGSIGFIQNLVLLHMGLEPHLLSVALIAVPLILAILIGISCAFVAVPTQAALQEAVPEDLRGKVFGAQNTAMSAASTFPVVLAGVSADNLPGGVSTTLLLIGVPTLLISYYHLSRISRTS
jgi:MFS family permease